MKAAVGEARESLRLNLVGRREREVAGRLDAAVDADRISHELPPDTVRA